MFNAEVMREINLNEEIRKVPIGYQSIMIHEIEKILEGYKDGHIWSISATNE